MFIKKITKKDRKGNNAYIYYRLVHSYKVGTKNRQQTILNLGKLINLPKEKHKQLADRIESILSGVQLLSFNIDDQIENLAQGFAKKIIKKGVFPVKKKIREISKDIPVDYQEVDINSIEQIESRSMGAEWLVKQAFDKMGFADILSQIGMSSNETGVALMLLASKIIHPSSELETQRWIEENSGLGELYNLEDNHPVTRYRLYKAATAIYKNKEQIEGFIYNSVQNLFSKRSKIVIYDLTNMHFAGQMLMSKKAQFGRSKQKRNDKRLVGLALAIDGLGFVRYSKIYNGNVSEPGTFSLMLDDVISQVSYTKAEKPVVVMDAGISTKENLNYIKQCGFDYVCVSRIIPKNFTNINEQGTLLTDNRNNQIEVTKVKVEDSDDHFVCIKSAQKELKERSISDKITERFEHSMSYLKEGLNKPRRLKKIVPVHEKVGRIKKQFSKVSKLFKITYKEDNKKGVVTDIKWELQKQKQTPAGQYFLRYSRQNLSEKQIWDTYNMTREVEATFRCLKTDLNVRPIYHQKDKYIEPHIFLSILAYQVINYIRQKLKEEKINYSWTTINQKMQAIQSSLQSIKKSEGSMIYMKLCTKPNTELKSIFDALHFKYRPYVRKIKVVTQHPN